MENKKITVRFNEEYLKMLEEIKEQLEKVSIVSDLTDSDVIRHAIKKFYDEVKKK